MRKNLTATNSLSELLAAAWTMLERGAARSTHPFHQAALATGKTDGCGLRTVILRDADEAQRSLICYADDRSAKTGEIAQSGCAAWLFYHPRKKIQVRIHGPATVHTRDSVAEAQWKRVKGLTRLSFCTEQAPGTRISKPSSGLSDRLLKDLPRLLSGNSGRDHFAAIVGRVACMDWLQLRKPGNIRARFRWEDGRLDSTWTVP